MCIRDRFYNESESRITIETGKDTTFEIALKPEKVSKSPWTATVISAESGELIENAKLEIIPVSYTHLSFIIRYNKDIRLKTELCGSGFYFEREGSW